MTTKNITIDQLTEGDTVTHINGVARPFPYTVTKVINTVIGKDTYTRVNWAHGGLITPCDPKTAIATVNV